MFCFKMTSSESDSDTVWKRKAHIQPVESLEMTFWATPPRAKKLKKIPETGAKKSSKVKNCNIKFCQFQISNMHKHIKFHHLPAFASHAAESEEVKKWEEYLLCMCQLLQLESLGQLLDYVIRNELNYKDPVELTQLDFENMNRMADKLGEEKETKYQFSKVTKKSQLIHWTVLSRVLDKLNQEQLDFLSQAYPSPALLNEIENKKFFIFGDSIIRKLGNALAFNVPVFCAPGVTMCKPDQHEVVSKVVGSGSRSSFNSEATAASPTSNFSFGNE